LEDLAILEFRIRLIAHVNHVEFAWRDTVDVIMFRNIMVNFRKLIS